MKKIYVMMLAVIFGITAANATVHTIAVTNNLFTPASVNANVGDTIVWVWSQGFHTTTSTTIPATATAWDAPLDNTAPQNMFYTYIPAVAGTYNYKCSNHSGMTGVINVASASGITAPTVSTTSSAYPNPFREKITVAHSSIDAINIYNMVGEKIRSITVDADETKTVLELSELPAGVYFYSTVKAGTITETRRIVKTH